MARPVTTKTTTGPAPQPRPRISVRLSHDARKALVAAPQLADYARNALRGPLARRLVGPVAKRLRHTDLFEALFPEVEETPALDALQLRGFLYAWRRRAGEVAAPRVPRDGVAANVRRLARVLRLSEVEARLLRLYLDVKRYPELGEFLNALSTVAQVGTPAALASILSIDPALARRALAPSGPLLVAGVLDHQQGNDFPSDYELADAFAEVLVGAPLTVESLSRRLFLVDEGETLPPGAFAHLKAWPLAVQVLSAALAKKAPGINVLLYGPPGTGKTAFARALARAAGARLLHVGAADTQGDSATPAERLAFLRAGLRLGLSRSVMLFDELEDVLSGRFSRHHYGESTLSKLHFNQLLERASVPVLWTTNAAGDMDPAFLRRFALSVEFRPAGVGQRIEVLRRALGAKHRLSEADVEALGQRYDVSFAQASGAVETARLVSPQGQPTRGAIEGLLSASERLLNGPAVPPAPFEPARFRLEAVSCDADVAALAEAACAWRPEAGVPLSACFFGPPGTGKSELARYLAWRMRRRCVVKRASDILDKYVGESEKRIAEAFRSAEEDGAVLVFDEVDSLLRDRRGAHHSWEATQVNELLQQLEAFRGAVVCTTNLWKDIDAAALRRFVFKVEFRYLKPAQAVAVFRAHFGDVVGGAWTPERAAQLEVELSRVRTLAPGDFAAVSRRVRILGKPTSDAALVEALRLEAAARGAAAMVGFQAAAGPVQAATQ